MNQIDPRKMIYYRWSSGLPETMIGYVDYTGTFSIKAIGSYVNLQSSLYFFKTGIEKLPTRNGRIIISRLIGNPFKLDTIYDSTDIENTVYLGSSSYVMAYYNNLQSYTLIETWVAVLYDGKNTDFMLYNYNIVKENLQMLITGFSSFNILNIMH